MDEITQKFIAKKFSEYYKTVELWTPPEFEKREFGFIPFGGGMMIRHRAFQSKIELQNYLQRTAPAHAYHSSAYYQNPSASTMNEKRWQGADLIFDLDVDHIDTPCKQVHDSWSCRCGYVGKGIKPEKCPKCGGTKFSELNWLCDECLTAIKKEALKLIYEFLLNDFGFKENDLSVNFSGARGYHIHVRSKSVRELSQVGRREIVDYIRAEGLFPEFHGLRKDKGRIVGPKLTDPGWRGKLAKVALEFLAQATIEDLKQLPEIGEKSAAKIIENKARIIKALKEGYWDALPVRSSSHFWLNLLKIGAVKLGGEIDQPVTADVKRLIRLPTTIHGKTSFRATQISINKLEGFDPLSEAVVFGKKEISVQINEAPKFRLGEEIFGPFKNEKVVLPEAAAMFLICRGVAKLNGKTNI
ncbi:MAG: DNA primase small subunit PriS [Euryarchaeota archaeon]|nr:DNA primase small subunit PriS [Euryarchaeota archaeon]